MDILRKELNAIYAAQRLDSEVLDEAGVTHCRAVAENLVVASDACAVITDAAADTCYIYGGGLARLLGFMDGSLAGAPTCIEAPSSDEDVIYERIHPEDLVEKRMLEYDFFSFVDPLPREHKTRYKATCRLRIRNRDDKYVTVDNSTQVLGLSPAGKIWLILCCYDLSPMQTSGDDIRPRIVSNATGEIITRSYSERRARVLTPREKDILRLIRNGRLSKEIAADLNISVNTVSRHRQNILGKLSVGNSIEAVNAAVSMGLL